MKNTALWNILKSRKKPVESGLGFSCHGRYDTLKRFLDTYGDDLEFCQIQLNYLDWKLQDAKAKVELLNEYEIPIWVMEPLRGENWHYFLMKTVRNSTACPYG